MKGISDPRSFGCCSFYGGVVVDSLIVVGCSHYVLELSVLVFALLCGAVHSVLSGFAVILLRKRNLVVLL